MNESKKRYLQDILVGWRRMDAWGASQLAARMFGPFMIGLVAWDWLTRDDIRFERALWASIGFAILCAASSMIFKTVPVFRK